MSRKVSSEGFSAIETIIVIVVVVATGLSGWYVWRHNHQQKKTTRTSNSTAQTKVQSPPPKTQAADPYAGWKTYTDTGYPASSEITVKYPAAWQVNVGNSKAFAWTITNSATPQASINARVSFLPASTTAQQEWDNCSSADSCGPTLDSTKLESSSSTINGLDSYNVKMQDSSGVYYATVIKSNKQSNDGVAFVELTYFGDDPTTLGIYKQVVASASF